MQFNATRSDSRVANQGTSPTLIELVVGKIILKNLENAQTVSEIALDGSGHAIGQPLVAVKNGNNWELTVGDPATMYYEILVTR